MNAIHPIWPHTIIRLNLLLVWLKRIEMHVETKNMLAHVHPLQWPIELPILFRIVSLASEQAYDFPNVSDENPKNMDKILSCQTITNQ